MKMIPTVVQSRKILKIMCENTYFQRLFSSNVTVTKLVYSQHGTPSKVLRKESDNIIEPKEDEVLLRILASPVNPVDINVIEGKYPVEFKLPAVAGSEGVGEVLSVGPKVSDFQKGDRAVMLNTNFGTWRSHLTVPQNAILKVPKELGLVEAATLTINPCTAYRMLKDFADLKPGDTVIQNGANSACGQNVIQLAHAWGINTVNVIRQRPNVHELKGFLNGLGATHVLTEEELKSTDIFKSGKVVQPKLALDCVGGKSASGILKNLQNRCKLVVYGGMSKEPLSIPASALIFKDNEVRGFRISNWMADNERNEKWHGMFEELISTMSSGNLKGPVHEFVDIDGYEDVLNNVITERGMVGKKFILSFNK